MILVYCGVLVAIRNQVEWVGKLLIDGSREFPVCPNEEDTIPQNPAYLVDNAPFSNAGCIWLHDSLIATLLHILPLPSGSLTFTLYLSHPSKLMNRGLSLNSYAFALAPLRVSLPTVHSWLGESLSFSFLNIIVEQKTHQRMARFFCYTISKRISTVVVCYLCQPGLGWMLVTCAGKSETAGIRMKTPRKSLSIQSNVFQSIFCRKATNKDVVIELILVGKAFSIILSAALGKGPNML